jgi:hypothetical protein
MSCLFNLFTRFSCFLELFFVGSRKDTALKINKLKPAFKELNQALYFFLLFSHFLLKFFTTMYFLFEFSKCTFISVSFLTSVPFLLPRAEVTRLGINQHDT